MNLFCRRSFDAAAQGRRRTASAVDTAESALAVIAMAMHSPPRPEVIALVLDAELRGRTIVVVDGATAPDAVVDVAELLGESAAVQFGGGLANSASFVLATVRPGDGLLPGDTDRWLELSDVADRYGCELIEWFVIDGDVGWCPRDLVAEPPRWPSP